MTTTFFCPYWGLENLSYADAARNVKAAGYDGMEIAIRDDTFAEAVQATKKNGLDLILMAFGGGANFPEHKQKYRADLLKTAGYKPRFINAHTGHDYFTYEQNCELIQVAMDVQQQTGTPILHETHRGRFSYSAPAMQHYLVTFPNLRLTGDFSHWVNVSESYLTEQADSMARTLKQTDHIHCRVGHPEGPQVSDPRAPEWQEALDIHARWWDTVRQRLQTAGATGQTITCEFGPAPGYLPTLPYTRQPVVSQWEVNVFMMTYLKKRWGV